MVRFPYFNGKGSKPFTEEREQAYLYTYNRGGAYPLFLLESRDLETFRKPYVRRLSRPGTKNEL